jgi:RNA polymerase sigma-70 factor (ECF subfamily)
MVLSLAAGRARPAHLDLIDRAGTGDDGAFSALVVSARAGDVLAFDAVVTSRLHSTYRLARAILGTAEDAEDATQEAFLSAWRNLPSLRDADRFDAWFGRIVVNACRTAVRRRPRMMLVSADALFEWEHPGAEDRAEHRLASSDALQRAVDRLPIDQRRILALRHLEGRSMVELGRILDVPVGTAKWRLHRARLALERAIEAES